MQNDGELIRYLMDLIDSKIEAKFQEKEKQPVVVHVHSDSASDAGGVDPTEVDSPMDRDDVFVPPLQAKIEMMKKMTGIPPKDETLKQSQEQGGPEHSASMSVRPGQLRAKFRELIGDDDEVLDV